MQTVALSSHLSVSALCFGTADWGTTTPEAKAERLLMAYVEAGGNFLDTAHVYAFWQPNGLGQSERTVGNLVRRLKLQNQVVVATKGGHHDISPDYPRPAHFLAPEVLASDIHESLQRLQMDTTALYYLHRDDGKTPVSEIIDCLNEHIQAGRIHTLGASNWSPARIAEANAYADANGKRGFDVSQIQGSLAVPTWQETADPTVRRLNDEARAFHTQTQIPVVAYSATASGYFARSDDDSSYDTPPNQARRERARTVAQTLNATPTQIAIAYLRASPFPVIPAFSTKSEEHLQEILGSVEIALTPEQVAYLEGP
jgi:aryl-alcohol dehydrogenase-like predicted oxidoreductase